MWRLDAGPDAEVVMGKIRSAAPGPAIATPAEVVLLELVEPAGG